MNSSREDYLQTIYRLCQNNGYATNKDISMYLNISKASVTQMLRKLINDKLVTIKTRKIYLTPSGLTLAKKLLSTHRLWEYFLENVLNLNGEIVHKQADLLEHATTPKLFEALNKYLDYPLNSPNGKKIFVNEKLNKEKGTV